MQALLRFVARKQLERYNGENRHRARPCKIISGTWLRTYPGYNFYMTAEKSSKISRIRNFSIIAHIDD